MKLIPAIDLLRSLKEHCRLKHEAAERDAARQSATVDAILGRMFDDGPERRELVLLADEVGLGKTYVALAAAVSVLDAIRRGEAPEGVLANRPAVLVLTPDNDALHRKWLREAAAFRGGCAAAGRDLDWLEVFPGEEGRCKNVFDLTSFVRQAKRSKPRLIVAKAGVFGKAIEGRYEWRKRALAAVFHSFRLDRSQRLHWCRRVLDTWSEANVGELLDLRRAGPLWEEAREEYGDVRAAYEGALGWNPPRDKIARALDADDAPDLIVWLDWLTRLALCWDWPRLPLLIIDEIHNLKNAGTATRGNLETCLEGKCCRLLGLSATPFQLRHEELESVLELRCLIGMAPERRAALDGHAEELGRALEAARSEGAAFRQAWREVRRDDPVEEAWREARAGTRAVDSIRPARLGAAVASALRLESANRALEGRLRPFVIRHRHEAKRRRHHVGRDAAGGDGAAAFAWRPGLEADGESELAHYLFMRAVALAKDERGLPPLGAELTGSYRHLTDTASLWRRVRASDDEQLRLYAGLLDGMVSAEREASHPKIKRTVARVLEAFRRGQKSLVFCVHIKTAEALRDEINKALEAELAGIQEKTFKMRKLENFTKRFSTPHEPLFGLLQDHPLLDGGEIPEAMRLGSAHFRDTALLLSERGGLSQGKADRRRVLAAVERVAASAWGKPAPELPEMERTEEDAFDRWLKRLGGDALAGMLGPYFKPHFFRKAGTMPLLPRFHGAELARLSPGLRGTAVEVFGRMLRADEFLLRYLASDPPSDDEEDWAEYLSRRYEAKLAGGESLRERFAAYLETLARAEGNDHLRKGYESAARNQNMVQLVTGGTADRDDFFLGFNTPYRPEVLVVTSVGQEGIDLHRECRHVVHHDLCWNPATIEQRTGRTDRLGSKAEREAAPLDVAVPYLAATYDERMFEELHRRAQLFEVTMGGDFDADGPKSDEGEDLGVEGESGEAGLPSGLADALRLDLSVWPAIRLP
ncbi:MAG: hypothetical protein K2W96_14045 [Gemmataceae bacterium]|nr:hypothetical protein [Gemmataceae bacterium]